MSMKKIEREVCLLFWLKICSIFSVYFTPILVLKFQLKISVKKVPNIEETLVFFCFLFYSTLEPF